MLYAKVASILLQRRGLKVEKKYTDIIYVSSQIACYEIKQLMRILLKLTLLNC